ncbi:MAG TPA: hypothetical protein VG893_16125 [Terracidiphilus sp.]|nr:hypothetical protein [Terracidiphilus sp.]
MDLLERYLQAVGRHLPWQRQADILAELRANLEAQREEREAELGRPLTQAETEEWIKQLGSPLQMAARYQPQQYLIGPSVFPVYWYVLRLSIFWATIIYTIVNVVLLAVNGVSMTETAAALARIPSVLFITAGWVTLVFAALEVAARQYPQRCAPLLEQAAQWQGEGLPYLDPAEEKGKKPRPYTHAVAEFIFGVLFLAWLLLVPGHPYLLMGPGEYYYASLPYRLSPVWMEFYWAVIALNTVQVVWSAVSLLNGSWQGPRRVQHLVSKALGFVPVILLVTAPNHLLFVLKNPGADEVRYGQTLYTINENTHLGLMVVLAIIAIQLVWETIRAILESSRERAMER